MSVAVAWRIRSGGALQFLVVNPTIPHNSLYLAKRRSKVEALFSHHDELREICISPLTATSCNARPEMLQWTNRRNVAESLAIQSSEMKMCNRSELRL